MIELRSVSKRYNDGAAAVEDLSMTINSGEICILIGPSGCGKTTTLRMINRLIEPTSGEILIDGIDVLAVDPVQLRRGIGFVMQSGGLFPHRRVADNVATVPRLLGWPADKVAARVEELLQLVGLDPATYLRRYPHELSGGERQRVGVARALGADPPILLMDEPFGAVDPIARKRLQVEFKELQKRLNKTVVFVTHDIEEALFLGDRIAIMQRGANLEQFDTPEAILAKPATPFVAEFVGVDRDLQRLAVTTLSLEDVEVAPSASIGTSSADLLDLARSTGTGLVVVLAKDGSPLGRVELAGTESSDLSVLEMVRPFSATLPLGASLKTALSTMLQDDDPFVVVTDAGRYVGVLGLEGLHRAMRRVS
jgi:osmoprotectant transport system ATP-binding protein